jgi:hypothetical protein
MSKQAQTFCFRRTAVEALVLTLLAARRPSLFAGFSLKYPRRRFVCAAGRQLSLGSLTGGGGTHADAMLGAPIDHERYR